MALPRKKKSSTIQCKVRGHQFVFLRHRWILLGWSLVKLAIAGHNCFRKLVFYWRGVGPKHFAHGPWRLGRAYSRNNLQLLYSAGRPEYFDLGSSLENELMRPRDQQNAREKVLFLANCLPTCEPFFANGSRWSRECFGLFSPSWPMLAENP